MISTRTRENATNTGSQQFTHLSLDSACLSIRRRFSALVSFLAFPEEIWALCYCYVHESNIHHRSVNHNYAQESHFNVDEHACVSLILFIQLCNAYTCKIIWQKPRSCRAMFSASLFYLQYKHNRIAMPSKNYAGCIGSISNWVSISKCLFAHYILWCKYIWTNNTCTTN